MENNEKELLNTKFPSNSKTTIRDSAQSSRAIEKKVEKIITGTATKQKRGIGKWFSELFLADDTKSVGSYVFHDVLIPAAKAMISDMVSGGVEMLLFGDRRGRSSRSGYNNGRGSFTSYGSLSRQSDRREDPRDRERDAARADRARFGFDNFALDSLGEAELVQSNLMDLIIDYDKATVKDFYDLVGATAAYTDEAYGWYSLEGMGRPRRIRDGRYILDLPRPQLLN